MRGTHIMTDIETLGVKEGATIFQVAAAAFNMQTGEIYGKIDLKLDIQKADLSVDGNTLIWWLNENKELLNKLLREGAKLDSEDREIRKAGGLNEIEMFTQFAEWIEEMKQKGDGAVRLWGNGILFDNNKIKVAMERLGLKYPIAYNKDRDVRTILALAADVTGKSEKQIKSEVEDKSLVAHDAMDDVTKQINFVRHCYNLIKGIE